MKTISPYFIVLIFFSTVLSAQTDPRTSWPVLGGDSYRTSASKIDLEFPLKVKTIFSMPDMSEHGMSYSGGQVYILANAKEGNTILAFSIDENKMLWDYVIPNTAGAPNFTPTLSGNLMIAAGQGSNRLYTFSRQTGELAYSIPAPSLFSRSPMVDETSIYFGRDTFYCLNQASGQPDWFWPEPISTLTPVLDDERVYIGNNSGTYAFDKSSGDIAWSNDQYPLQNFASLALDESKLYLGLPSEVYALNKFTGDFVWSGEIEKGTILNDYAGAFVVTDDHLFVKQYHSLTGDTHYSVLNKENGNKINAWSHEGMVYQTPTLVNDMIVEFADNKLVFYNDQNGAEEYSMDFEEITGTSSQVLAVDDYIILTGNSTIIVLESASASTEEQFLTLNLKTFPNPFRQAFTLEIELSARTDMSVDVMAMEGKIVADVYSGTLAPGTHQLPVDLSILPAGNYLLKASYGERLDQHYFHMITRED